MLLVNARPDQAGAQVAWADTIPILTRELADRREFLHNLRQLHLAHEEVAATHEEFAAAHEELAEARRETRQILGELPPLNFKISFKIFD